MKRYSWILLVLALLVAQAPKKAWADSKEAEKTLCAISDFAGKNKAFDKSRSAITYGLTAFGGVLAAMINIEAQRKKLETGLKASSISLRALSWAGPLKAFGRVAIPLMDNTAKTIKSVKLDSKTAKVYKKVYTPLSYAWMFVNTGMYGVQVSGIFVCKRAKIMGVNVTKKGSEAKAKKFWATAKRSAKRINQTLSRMKSFMALVKKNKRTFGSLKKTFKPALKPMKKLEKSLKKINKVMKPVFSAAKKLVKEMKKRRCITYGVKVKVKGKVKVKKGKVKVKVKAKAKKVKFCFSIAKIAGKISKLAKPVQKPVNDLIKKVIKPLTKKIEKGIKKALKFGALKKLQKKAKQATRRFGAMKRALDKLKRYTKADKKALDALGRKLR